MHVWFSDILDDHRYIKVPSPYCFVVRGGDEAAVFINESNGVDRTQVLIVFLCNVAGVHIVLQQYDMFGRLKTRQKTETNLNNLLIRHTSEENVLFILIWVEPDDIRNLPITKAFDTLAGFSIP